MDSRRKRLETKLRNRAPQQPTELPNEVRNFMQIYTKPSYYWQKALIKLWSCESRHMEIKACQFGDVYYLCWAFAHLGHDGIYWRWFFTLEGLKSYSRQIIQTFNDIQSASDEDIKRIINDYKTMKFDDEVYEI